MTSNSPKRTNAEVARLMMVFGVVALAIAILLIVAERTLASSLFMWVFTSSNPGADLFQVLWSVLILLGAPLGSFLVVGSIIVNRLPERAPEH